MKKGSEADGDVQEGGCLKYSQLKWTKEEVERRES